MHAQVGLVESAPVVLGGVKEGLNTLEVFNLTVANELHPLKFCIHFLQENRWQPASFQLKENRTHFDATLVPSSFFYCWKFNTHLSVGSHWLCAYHLLWMMNDRVIPSKPLWASEAIQINNRWQCNHSSKHVIDLHSAIKARLQTKGTRGKIESWPHWHFRTTT